MSSVGSGKWVPSFLAGAFTTSMTLDVRQDYIKYGNKTGGLGAAKNPHAYIIFVF